MLKRSFSALIALSAIGLTSLDAQAISLGEFEYTNSCAQCHGASGKGDGWMAEFLHTPTSDLTVLQKKNGGVFPVNYVYKTIDGTEEVRIHGPREMPTWGYRFFARSSDDEDSMFTDADNREYARTRILALIEYISTIQAK